MLNPSIFSLPAQGRGLRSLPELWLCRVVLVKDVDRQGRLTGTLRAVNAQMRRNSRNSGVSRGVSESDTEQQSGKENTSMSPSKMGLASKPVRCKAGGGDKLEQKWILKRKELLTFVDASGVPRMSQEFSKYYFIGS